MKIIIYHCSGFKKKSLREKERGGGGRGAGSLLCPQRKTLRNWLFLPTLSWGGGFLLASAYLSCSHELTHMFPAPSPSPNSGRRAGNPRPCFHRLFKGSYRLLLFYTVFVFMQLLSWLLKAEEGLGSECPITRVSR